MNNENDKANSTIVHNQDENNVTNLSQPFDEYYDIFKMHMVPVKIEELIQKLLAWISRKEDKEKGIEEPFRFDDFLDEYGIEKMDYYRLKERHLDLQRTHDYTIRRLASIREKGAATWKYNHATIALSLGVYVPEVRQEQERLAALQKNSMPDQKLILMIPAAPNSDEVKFRQLKNESIDIKVQKE